MATRRQRYLLVDGHSVIFQWDELRQLHERQPRQARQELIRQLTQHQDASGEQVVLVFDGTGGPRPTVEKNTRSCIQIVYATAGATADAIIEKLVRHYAQTYDLLVATADIAEQMSVCSLGAHAISPENLRQHVQHAGRDLNHRLKNQNGQHLSRKLGSYAWPEAEKPQKPAGEKKPKGSSK
jgi:uncharacterized protein